MDYFAYKIIIFFSSHFHVIVHIDSGQVVMHGYQLQLQHFKRYYLTARKIPQYMRFLITEFRRLNCVLKLTLRQQFRICIHILVLKLVVYISVVNLLCNKLQTNAQQIEAMEYVHKGACFTLLQSVVQKTFMSELRLKCITVAQRSTQIPTLSVVSCRTCPILLE